MSANAVIVELSKQIAHLQSQYDALLIENQKLQTLTTAKVNRKSQSQLPKKANVHFDKSVHVLKEKRLMELSQQYRDELEFIRARYPRWNPDI
ncbi:hypothetical protein [Olivibacter sitiensis]|uniref:hypothetical protein n=1 Tax=Olivibacter sitiensis TaxID=376470 RepID=UPI0004153447|nr:hypothetical protein [Olivibacter sitiensis]